ncbi:cold-shock protein [Mucilaginibacter ginsenosidivorans]|uniref:Cold shock domain-containing protein n=1 Tax=Mucilaginibacter ginsenosidivorans TaxID=398053 RepID=A0A5B8UZP7_9SPHI|nr:cold shock domain-containing protein [Mucilaginibacter ginsenosidivorans]QEC64650.1 cold shock domain-containing protein [Mucilaginibacter ginsenosidivorans]
MGRSTETFSKKEREKARQKKSRDKKEKAEERKANAGKGKSLEDMMAYIDEYGNITSTPPDPSRKIKVNAEDIQVGVAKQTDIPVDTVRNGVVSFFNESKGYGFIKDLQTQESIFVHINALTEPLKENNMVTFETEQGQKGLSAIKVKKK